MKQLVLKSQTQEKHGKWTQGTRQNTGKGWKERDGEHRVMTNDLEKREEQGKKNCHQPYSNKKRTVLAQRKQLDV